MNLLVTNQEEIKISTHFINTGNKCHLHRPTGRLPCFVETYMLCWFSAAYRV